MILYEYEGKKILADCGLIVPRSELITSLNQKVRLNYPTVLKAQVLSGKRAQAGGIIVVEKKEDLEKNLPFLLGKIINKEKVEAILAEEKIDFEKEFYLSLSYDTNTRGPVLTISQQGGTGVEHRAVKTFPIDPTNPYKNLPEISDRVLIKKLIDLFFSADCLLLEINPLVLTKKEQWIALDAKIKLDDTAVGRHKDWKFPSRSAPGHIPTKNETEAKKIDEGDYRGVAGSTYFDLPGDIAVLASGGGASLTALDALIKAGGKPANYTEYGGNPPREKVAKLTKIVLDKPNLNGLWVVGALANFTNIYETLSGFIEGLRDAQTQLGKKFTFPIVIRRAGPHDREAREMLAQVKDFDLHIYGEETSITQSAEIVTKLAKEYERRKNAASS